jgi:hypothetical protein
MGDDGMDSSPSVSAPRIDPALLENGTLSPFLKLPFLYVVRVDLRNPTPGAWGNIGISSVETSSPPELCWRFVSSDSFRMAFDGSRTNSSNS